ncbi:hypothetical protein L7F22_052262 [Adiantum nelumboides]|nr:hypothetical protein [Adiantum nelumboides]
MQLITYRLLRNSVGQRIKIHRIMKYFPDQNELQMRQRLKEFMEYNRRAGDKDQGYWKLKQGHVPPLESELQAKLPPEYMCLSEAMQAGQRHLLDAGYTRTAEGDEDGDESKMDVEQLLAPWITTKNFLHATQGKAMLKLHGEGDPSGRGEAFSFLRVSMKDIFVRAGETEEERLAIQEQEEQKSGHKYNVARQQQVYKEEIQRIWDAQRKALSNPVPPELTHEDVIAAQQADMAARSQTPMKSGLHARGQSRAGSVRRDGTPGWDRAGTPGGMLTMERAVPWASTRTRFFGFVARSMDDGIQSSLENQR